MIHTVNIYLKKLGVGMRQGLLLSDSKSDTLRNYNNYDLVQRFITNPYLINGYKLNLRYFLVVDCYPRQTYIFIEREFVITHQNLLIKMEQKMLLK